MDLNTKRCGAGHIFRPSKSRECPECHAVKAREVMEARKDEPALEWNSAYAGRDPCATGPAFLVLNSPPKHTFAEFIAAQDRALAKIVEESDPDVVDGVRWTPCTSKSGYHGYDGWFFTRFASRRWKVGPSSYDASLFFWHMETNAGEGRVFGDESSMADAKRAAVAAMRKHELTHIEGVVWPEPCAYGTGLVLLGGMKLAHDACIDGRCFWAVDRIEGTFHRYVDGTADSVLSARQAATRWAIENGGKP